MQRLPAHLVIGGLAQRHLGLGADGGNGCAQLVGHRREKFALGPIGRFRSAAGLKRFRFRAPAFDDFLLQFLAGGVQLRGAFGDLLLQLRIERLDLMTESFDAGLEAVESNPSQK